MKIKYHLSTESQASQVLMSMDKISGIYKIINKTNGKYYVGSSNNVGAGGHSRWRQHSLKLIKGNHDNEYLQNAWNAYGKDNFEFVIVEEVSLDKLLIVEQKYLDLAKTEPDKCYNLKFEAMGGQWRECSKNKMRGSNNPMFGKTHTDEVKKILSEISKGRKLDNETKRKLSQYRLGKTYSEETKRRISESKKGINNPNYGKPLSESHRRKIGEAIKKRREKLSSPALQYDFSPTGNQSLGDSGNGIIQHLDPSSS